MSCVQFTDVPRFASWLIYFILLLCRFIIVIHVQSGYLHPDEFFQSLEVAAGDIYNLRVFRPWEFSVSDDGGPLRSIAGISPMVHLPIRIYKGLYADSAFHIPSSEGINSTLPYTGAELLNRIVLPTRLFTTFCSLIVDVFILYSCAILRKPNRPGRRCFLSISPPVSLILYASAVFGGLLYSTRTLANTWELTSVSAFGLLFTLIIRSCQLPVLSKWVFIRVAFFLLAQAVLSMWSIFVRTTYPLFILPMAVVEICVIMHHFGLWFSFWISSACVLVASFVAYVCLLVDTIYYSIPNWFSEWLDLSDMVCVPCRFIAYNKVSENVVTHGYHPYYFHLLVNLPQMVGPVIILLALWPPGRRNLMSYVLWTGCVLPVMILSCVPHQEARFLLPIIPQLLLLAGHRLESSIKTHRASLIYSIWKSKLGLLLTIFWVLHQLVLLIFYGNLHQGGLVKFYSTLAPANDRSCSTNVFYRTYMPPRFPFGTLADKNDAMGVGCHEVLDVQDLNQLNSAMDQHAVTSRPVINLIYPGSLSPPINGYNFGPVREHRSIFGHLSTEDWPHLFSNTSTSVTDFLNNLHSQLSLHIFSICTDEKQCIV